ncbi:MAG TPA: hypothetical protein VFP89_10485 [Propionibacteriaceae bacterium]|nr:hypothetical protein [Propionibacteriaceae bacterium]
MTAGWKLMELDDFGAAVRSAAGSGPGPRVVAVDGHSSSGKSTLSTQLVSVLGAAAVVHTDDLAWHHSAFDWADLLVTGVLAPLRAGQDVSYQPPGWAARGRTGAVEVPGAIDWLVVEGVGASRLALAGRLDVTVWIETDAALRRSRDAARVAAGEISPEDYASWMREENAFLAADRPWTRASFVVSGSGRLGAGPKQVVVADGRRSPGQSGG